jgi:phosphoglycerol transferase MdoB-like AlkP superfamily enzyme
MCAFTAFLGTLGAAAIVVGMHDSAFDSASVGVTALSALLLVVGVVLLVAAYHLVRLTRRSTLTDDWRPQPKSIVLVAFLLTIVLGIYVFFAAIGTSGAQRIVVVAGALAIIVAGLLGVRFFGRDARITHLRVEGAIALGVIGIVVGVGQFWFQNQYVPSHAGRAVALKVALSVRNDDSGLLLPDDALAA